MKQCVHLCLYVAVDLCSLPQRPICTNGAALIVIDGTWSQARGLFTHNEFLHTLQQVSLINAYYTVVQYKWEKFSNHK